MDFLGRRIHFLGKACESMMELSVIIPARTGDERIQESKLRVLDWMLNHFPNSELILSVDTLGKGHGVKEGMLKVRGLYVVVMDVDLPVPFESIIQAVRVLRDFNYDFVQGKRVHRNDPYGRRFLGWGFRALVKHRTGLSLDTQCGFQVWKVNQAKWVIASVKTDGYIWPVEFYLLAERMGFRTCELPVNWKYDPNSTVSLRKDILGMWHDLWHLSGMPNNVAE